MDSENFFLPVLAAAAVLVCVLFLKHDISREELISRADYIAVVDLKNNGCYKDAKGGVHSRADMFVVTQVKGRTPWSGVIELPVG